METLGTFKSFKYSWTEEPNVCRMAATMTVYCVVRVVSTERWTRYSYPIAEPVRIVRNEKWAPHLATVTSNDCVNTVIQELAQGHKIHLDTGLPGGMKNMDSLEIIVFWDVPLCSIGDIDRRFRSAYYLHDQEQVRRFKVLRIKKHFNKSSPWWRRQ
jgi:hypothetical protein